MNSKLQIARHLSSTYLKNGFGSYEKVPRIKVIVLATTSPTYKIRVTAAAYHFRAFALAQQVSDSNSTLSLEVLDSKKSFLTRPSAP